MTPGRGNIYLARDTYFLRSNLTPHVGGKKGDKHFGKERQWIETNAKYYYIHTYTYIYIF